MRTLDGKRIAGWLCCLVTLASAAIGSAAPHATRRVLLLHQAGAPGPSHGRFALAFVEAIRSVETSPIDLYEETIETERFPGTAQSPFAIEYLKNKYADRKIDVIVAQGVGSLAFARRNGALFGNPPIVAIVSSAGQIPGNDDNVTGLQGGPFINGTIDLALALRPSTQCVFVVDGARENSGALQAEVERQLNARPRRIGLTYLRDLPLAELVMRIAAAPDDAVVLFVKQTMLNRSQDVDQLEALSQVVRASPVPVFSPLESVMGHGIVGGYVWRFEPDVRRVADMASRLANGGRPRDIPPGHATYTALLDWRELQRWHIPGARVPLGSVVLFRPQSFYELYRWYVVGALAIFAAQLVLIGGLLVQRIRRQRAEAQTRNSEDRYRSVVDTQSELICRFLPDSTLTFANDAYCRFWNKTREELLGRKFLDLIPPPARQAVLERIARLSRGVDAHEHPVTLPDGTVGWHHWINHAILDDQGRLIELQGVGRDITDRKRAEEALREAEARNSAMLRAIPDLMFVLRPDGTYVDYHAKDPTLLFLPPGAFIGRKIRDILPPAVADAFMDALDRASRSDETVVVEYELCFSETRHFEARLVHAGGDRVLSMVRDVTESRRAMELNRDLAGRLIASQEIERQRIARDLHDDLSQKIALLNIEIEQVAAQITAQGPRVRLREISERAGEIATDVHNLSHQLHPSKLQTLGLVVAVQALCRDISQQGGVQVFFTHGVLPPSIDPSISLCLYRIAQEALHNVARHSQAREARVRLAHADDALLMQIIDSGVGFDPRTGFGGLGLVSMRERVAFLRGHLAIDAVPGVGTRISVRVPLTRQARNSAPAVSQSA